MFRITRTAPHTFDVLVDGITHHGIHSAAIAVALATTLVISHRHVEDEVSRDLFTPFTR